jgi:N utilization substance protein A
LKRDVQPGDTLDIEIPPSHLGRIAAQTARQMILQKIREAERKNVYDEYKDRIGDIVSGTIRQIIHRDLIVELGKTEAILPAKERLPSEEYNVGERIRAYVYRVQSGVNGPAVVLSRACSDFVKTLFRLEVAEIADGSEVMGLRVIRTAPNRSQTLMKIDPVGAARCAACRRKSCRVERRKDRTSSAGARTSNSMWPRRWRRPSWRGSRLTLMSPARCM